MADECFQDLVEFRIGRKGCDILPGNHDLAHRQFVEIDGPSEEVSSLCSGLVRKRDRGQDMFQFLNRVRRLRTWRAQTDESGDPPS